MALVVVGLLRQCRGRSLRHDTSRPPGSPTLYSSDKGQTRVSEDRQPHHNGLHQQTVPGLENRGTDLMTRGVPLPDEWWDWSVYSFYTDRLRS